MNAWQGVALLLLLLLLLRTWAGMLCMLSGSTIPGTPPGTQSQHNCARGVCFARAGMAAEPLSTLRLERLRGRRSAPLPGGGSRGRTERRLEHSVADSSLGLLDQIDRETSLRQSEQGFASSLRCRRSLPCTAALS